MKYAVLSDIHGNLEALRSVLNAVRSYEVDRYICLGDIVGYGANPQECVEIISALEPVAVLGNHDAGVCGFIGLNDFTPLAYKAIVWTRMELNSTGLNYLSDLPLVQSFREISICHSNLAAPESWFYIFRPEDAVSSFRKIFGWVCFFGHSHCPVIYRQISTGVVSIFQSEYILSPEERYMVNCGSVGQPRDRDPRASFALFDDDSGYLKIIRVSYPIKKAQKKIREAGLPDFLAARLAEGI